MAMPNNSRELNEPGFETRCLHVGVNPEEWSTWEVVPPIVTSVIHKAPKPGIFIRGYDYARDGNPTRSVLEKKMASLDNAKYGFVFSSGMAATTTVVHLLNTGEHILSVDDLYGGVSQYFSRVVTRMGISVTYADFTSFDNVKKNLKPNTRMVLDRITI